MARRGMSYDTPAVYANLIGPRYAPIADALVRAAALDEHDDALELGAGTGLVTKRAASAVRSLLATDASAEMLVRARSSLRRHRNVTYAVRRLERTGFRSVVRNDIELSNRFRSVDDYLAYRRGFGMPVIWTRAFYERFLEAVRREATAAAATDGSFELGWTFSLITARRPNRRPHRKAG